MRASIVAVVLGLSVGGCIHTQEMPLAPNVVRLDTQASGLLFVNQATGATMKRAAETTIEHGYTHFRLDQGQLAQGSQYVGSVSSGQATGYGTATATGPGTAAYTGTMYSSSSTTGIFKPTSSVGVTVIMFKADELGAQGAFNAQEVLKKAG